MSKTADYEVNAGDTLSFEVGTSLIDTVNPIDVNWSCRVGLKRPSASALLVDRPETATNADNTKYVPTFTETETDQKPGSYKILIQLSNATIGYKKTVAKTLKILEKMLP